MAKVQTAKLCSDICRTRDETVVVYDDLDYESVGLDCVLWCSLTCTFDIRTRTKCTMFILHLTIAHIDLLHKTESCTKLKVAPN